MTVTLIFETLETCKITKVFFSRAKAKVFKCFKEKKIIMNTGCDYEVNKHKKTKREKGLCWDHDRLGLWVALMKPASY